MTLNLIIEADGGSRGNPGPSGSGAVVINRGTGEILIEIAEYIGTATNNVAEYRALLAAVREALALDPGAHLEVRMDSKLVIEQMSGAWKIKHPDMQALAIQVHQLLAGRAVGWTWIPREQNSRADALANMAMDTKRTEILHASASPTVAVTPVASTVEFNAELPSSVRAPGGVTKPLTTLILVRHGRTALTESKRISGSGGADPELSDAGLADAAAVAAELAKVGTAGPWAHLKPPSAIVTSPIARTRGTAEAIGKALHLDPIVLDGIREISFGAWDGNTNDEARAMDPQRFEDWRGSWEVAPPGGESLRDFDDRIRAARNQILERFAGETVVVVSHVMPIRGFIRAAFDADIAGYWRPQISPCSITILRLWGGEAAEVTVVNATHHLSQS
ncbi:MAG: bifunctional RNase H/acid phosphatase [Micrococcales bacterium]